MDASDVQIFGREQTVLDREAEGSDANRFGGGFQVVLAIEIAPVDHRLAAENHNARTPAFLGVIHRLFQ